MRAKPFIKWVGGKGQLIEQIDALLPNGFAEWKNAIYIEPFVGGGAMLFYMLQRYPNIKTAVINDINTDLIGCYTVIKNNPEGLIAALDKIEDEYKALCSEENRKDFFLEIRERYNTKQLDAIDNASLFIFLNRTCFNGLYRVNKAGKFNVPFGRYANPRICNAELIREDSELLQKVEIMTGDFEGVIRYATNDSLVYFDPPYRPISNTSSFNDYTKEAFCDDEQIRLKLFCDRLNDRGCYFMLSNSDSKIKYEDVSFFDNLYKDYYIERVFASRSVNANPSKRGVLTEILVRNYKFTKQTKSVRHIFMSKDVEIVAEEELLYERKL